MDTISRKTPISLGLVLTIGAILFASGVLWTKMEYVEREVAQLSIEIAAIRQLMFSNSSNNYAQSLTE